MAVLAADARLLVAAKWHFDRGQIVGVDPAGACLQLVDHPVRPLNVPGENARGKAEVGVVRAGDDVVLIGEVEHAQHRAEDFLAGNAHVVLHVGKDGRLHEIAVREAGDRG